MKRILILVFFSLLIIVSTTGCGSSSGPEYVVQDFFESVESGDVETAIEMLSSQIVTMLGREKLTAAIEERSNEINKIGGISSIVIKDKIEKEDSIIMEVMITYGDGSVKTETTKLVLEDGKWKIGISK